MTMLPEMQPRSNLAAREYKSHLFTLAAPLPHGQQYSLVLEFFIHLLEGILFSPDLSLLDLP
jgi:hypothetical protein